MTRFLLSVLMLLLGPGYLFAQVANNTSLVGTVTDSAGAVIIGAKVSAVEHDSKVTYTDSSNAQGYYSIPNILPGTYDITVEMNGFKKTLKTGAIVLINQSSRTDFQLAIGSTTIELTISANTPAISTDDALLGETLTADAIENLPMNGRHALDLATTASNVTEGGTTLSGLPPGNSFSGAGTRGVNNSITLDGISIMNDLGSTVTVTVNPDALGSQQTQNGNYTAQYGNYLGIHINQVTKSGTNAFHGTVYEYLQNDALNSRGFNHSITIPKKTALRYNLFGGEISGPIVIPFLYNGRDKAFFMGSYEGLRTHTITNSFSQAMTADERNGDFSVLLNPAINGASGKQVLLYSPFDGHPYFNLATGKQIIDDAPAASRSQVANILKFAALPNEPAGTILTQNNLTVLPSSTSEDSTTDRVDYNIGERIRIFGRFAYQKQLNLTAARDVVNNDYSPSYARNGIVGITNIFTPNLVNDFRAGFNWLVTNDLNYEYENGIKGDDTSLGIPGFNVGDPSGNPGLPTISAGYALSTGEQDGTNWFQDNRAYTLFDQISWTHGKHSFMAGVDVRRLVLGRAAVNGPRGELPFSSNYTATLGAGQSLPASCYPGGSVSPSLCSEGDIGASLYTGVLSGSTTPIFQIKEEVAQWRDGFFVQDTWNVITRLTLQYGVRYELPKVPYSVNGFGRIMNSTFTALIPSSSATNAADYVPQPGLAFTGSNLKDVAPRLGFSFRATDRFVIRGGGGIYYNPNHLNAYTLTSNNYPFAASVVYASPNPLKQNAGNPYDTVDNPSPGSGTASPVAGTPGTYVSAYSIQPHLPSETMYQWNLTNGIELWKNAGVEFQYLGSHSIHLDENYGPNQPTPGVGNQSLSVNARRPNQNFGSIRVATNDATATYNGLTTIFRQRASHGINGSISYTWAHTLDETADANSSGSAMYQGHLKLDYGNSTQDVRHRVVFSGSIGLPSFGQQNFLLRETIGGWQLNGIVTLASGTPFNVTLNTDWANVQVFGGYQAQRPSFAHVGHQTCTKALLLHTPYGANASCVDVTAYAAPAQYTYGNLRRNDLHGPGSISNNLSLFKNFTIFGEAKFQLRVEAFNAFNHANIGNPTNLAFNVANNNAGIPTLTPSSSVFGTVGSSGSGRTVQLAGRINF